MLFIAFPPQFAVAVMFFPLLGIKCVMRPLGFSWSMVYTPVWCLFCYSDEKTNIWYLKKCLTFWPCIHQKLKVSNCACSSERQHTAPFSFLKVKIMSLCLQIFHHNYYRIKSSTESTNWPNSIASQCMKVVVKTKKKEKSKMSILWLHWMKIQDSWFLNAFTKCFHTSNKYFSLDQNVDAANVAKLPVYPAHRFRPYMWNILFTPLSVCVFVNKITQKLPGWIITKFIKWLISSRSWAD